MGFIVVRGQEPGLDSEYLINYTSSIKCYSNSIRHFLLLHHITIDVMTWITFHMQEEENKNVGRLITSLYIKSASTLAFMVASWLHLYICYFQYITTFYVHVTTYFCRTSVSFFLSFMCGVAWSITISITKQKHISVVQLWCFAFIK